MKKIVILIVGLLILLIGFLTYKNISKKDNDNVLDSYTDYKFHTISNYKKDLFKIDEYEIDTSLNTESLDITINDNTINMFLLDDYIHIMSEGIDYKYENLGEIQSMMKFKTCNCNDDCIKIIILTEDGTLYYLNPEDISNLNDVNIFKKIEITNKINNIGFISNLNVLSSCGENALALITDEKNIILNGNLEEVQIDYYTYIGNEEKALYIYPDGSIKLYDGEYHDFDIKIEEAFVSKNIYYLVDSNKYLYKLENNELTKTSSKKVSKIGYRIKDDGTVDRALIVYEDDFIKQYILDINYKPLNI